MHFGEYARKHPRGFFRQFAKRAQVSEKSIYKAARGAQLMRPTALKIAKHTNGEVSAGELLVGFDFEEWRASLEPSSGWPSPPTED